MRGIPFCTGSGSASSNLAFEQDGCRKRFAAIAGVQVPEDIAA